ncbi:carbohydrate-binding protein [Acinetobacter sp. FL51]|uniref:phage nozzle protein n=1 Tax=Acinetobacter sp. FL51 TaxID=2777978 RepID=UPI0018E19044|nr:carbohydrate-binding protein [Acinetobacter sp. FL51]MBI1450388.1 carbohydrate-binding protein [Acinetobacter sp. FL51]
MKQWILKNNLSSGELSPLLYTRTDVQQYANGVKSLLNALPLVEGGAKRRPGTRYRGTFAGAVRLIPFIPNSENSYLLIFGLNKISVFDPRLQSIVWKAATPYSTVSMINEIQVAHTRYRMYFVQGNTPVRRLLCSADFSNWSFEEFIFSVAPTDEIGTSPNVALTPSGIDVGKTINLTATAFPEWNNTEQYLAGDRVIYSWQTWRAMVDNKGSTPSAEEENPKWETVTAEAVSVFTVADIGAVVSINSGQVKITSISSPTVAKGDVLVKLTADVQAIAKSWTLNSLAFTAATGYPRTVTFFKQRLVFGNTKTSPNQLWFSAIGSDSDFLESTEDADAFSIASSSAQSDNILHLAQRGGVVALTGGSEFLITASGPMTPASAQIEQHTSYGAQKDVRPCMVGSELLFVQRGGERLRALSYRYEVDGLVSPELSAIASHIPQKHGGIKEITYQQTPDSIVWIVLNDGKMASITLNRDQEMNAWAQHDVGGKVISACSLPRTTGSDQCYLIVQRGTHHFLEELSYEAMCDCEIPYESAMPSDVIETLNDQHVAWVNQDGYWYAELKNAENDSQAKWLGQLFTLKIELLPPDYSSVPSTAMFHKISVHNVVLCMNESLGGYVEAKELKHKKINGDAFRNLPFTGFVEEPLSGWCSLHELNLRLTHDKPLPFHVQSISMMVSINER